MDAALSRDRFSFTGSGKSGLGAALLYLLTGDTGARDAAFEFGDFLLATQARRRELAQPELAAGSALTPIDAAAEFNVWLQEIASTLSAGQARWG